MEIGGDMRIRGPAIPKDAKDISAQWLNEVLAPHLGGHQVLGSQAKPFTEPGQTADVVEIWLDYDSAHCPLPDHMIAKLAATDPQTREMSCLFSLYEKEVGFYQTFAGEGLPLARCYYSQFDPQTNDAVILLEHLAPSYSPGYGISPEQVGTALREVAAMHARWWNDNEVRHDPALVQLNDLERWESFAASAVSSIDDVRDFVGAQCEASIEVIRLYQEHLKKIVAFWQTLPFTLAHSDFHGKQMFFPNEKGEGKFALIDFQYPIAGPGTFDVSRLLNLGLSSEQRGSLQDRLIRDYLAALAANGVDRYGFESFQIDHKVGAMFSQLINVVGVCQTDHELIAEECRDYGLDWKDVWLLRGEAMLRELNVPDFLRAI